jgi:NADPH-dependent curcumin reductase CurA
VIGSVGSKAKVDYLVDELGCDAAFDYHDGASFEPSQGAQKEPGES